MSDYYLRELCGNAPTAVVTLLRAYDYAIDSGHSELDFAVELERLRILGLSDCDLRWLICKGFATHAIESRVAGEFRREFLVSDCLSFQSGSCLTLTSDGYDLLNEVRHNGPGHANTSADEPVNHPVSNVAPEPATSRGASTDNPPANGNGKRPESMTQQDPLHPRWCPDRKELRVNGHVVKRFKVPSRNQEKVLTVFEEEGWPVRIDDPLPSHSEIVRKRRLQDTIKGLNRNQQNQLIRFRGDGNGEGVTWEMMIQN